MENNNHIHELTLMGDLMKPTSFDISLECTKKGCNYAVDRTIRVEKSQRTNYEY